MQYASEILSSVACPAVQYLLRYLINGSIFEKKLLNVKRDLVFSERDIFINLYCSSSKVSLNLVRFQ
jgi:hypothetical protein